VTPDHLEWALQAGPVQRFMVALLALGVLALTALNLRQLASRRRQALLGTLRLLTVASLGLVWLQPTWVSSNPRPGEQKVAVLVDRSLSMAQGAEGERRFDRALAGLKHLPDHQPVQWFTWADQLEPQSSLDALRRADLRSPRTDLLQALASLHASSRPGNLSAVLVVSDGLDNGPLRARNPSGTVLDDEAAALLEGLRVPVHALHVGDRQPPRDLAVRTLRAASFGFTRTWLPLAVDLELSGYAEAEGEVTLEVRDDGKLVASQKVPLAGPSRRTIELDFQPLHVGTHLLEASVAPLPDEATVVNNRAWAGLRVVRDRTRVLLLAGHPSWDTRFLRSHLRGNPSIDLVSFYVMVGDGAGAYVASEDTTLIPFPTHEIFEQSLSSFDLIVFQDFPFGPFQIEQYLPQLRAYVTGGGAFAVFGGKQALSAGGYYGTGLADWLPLRLQALGGDDVGYVEGSMPLVLTPAGRSHPLTLLDADPEASATAWQQHTWVGRNTRLQAGEGGSVLVTDPGGAPLLAVGEVGEGRSAVLASDGLWQWAFPADTADAVRDRSLADYHRLLDRLMAWLLRDPDLDGLRVDASTDPVPPGQPLRLRVSAHAASGKPVAGLVGTVQFTPVGQAATEQTPTQTWPKATDPDGEAVLDLVAPAAGAWWATVEVTIDGRVHRATAPVVSAVPVGEWSQLEPDDRLLRALAAVSGGQVFKGALPTTGVPTLRKELPELAEQVHTELWNRPEVLLWLVLLLSAEWLLRRRWGLA
jgi:uncharacterized membrane protein